MADRRKLRGQRIRMAKRQGGKCYYCACPVRMHRHKDGQPAPDNMATLDHIIPLSKGGRAAASINCVVACHRCNNERGDRDARLFMLEKMGLA